MTTIQDPKQNHCYVDAIKAKPDVWMSKQHRTKVDQSILNSWQRSEACNIPLTRIAAPLQPDDTTQNTLDDAISLCSHELGQVATNASMVIAVADNTALIRWSKSSRQMQNATEQVHFIRSGQWREDLVGTNALALTLRTQQSSCVFTHEHYMSSVQDWICYAAPIYDRNRNVVGVIDLSTQWNKHNSLGILAAERCADMIQNAMQLVLKSKLHLKCLGAAKVYYQNRILALSPRQLEIVSILALCKDGMRLDQLHDALYGERRVCLSTLKAEMSQLRTFFGQQLASRPYRLMMDVDADFLDLEQTLNADCIEAALQRYTGIFLSHTESPFLMAWRNCLESRLSEAIFKVQEKELLLKYIAHFPDAIDAIERLMDLIPQQHPMRNLFAQHQA